MQHSQSWSTFTQDTFLTLINLIYKNVFYYQPFDGLSIIINTIKLYAKKEYKFRWHSNNGNKDKIYKLNIIVDEQRFFS